MIIRPGIEEDIPQVMELLREFSKESLEEYGLRIDETTAPGILTTFKGTNLLAEENGKIIGVIAGIITKYPLNDERIFQEAIWFISKQHRSAGIRLLRALEETAKREWGCSKLVMVYMGNSDPDKLREFYEKHGFRFLEAHYIKEL